jgi:hypothetical protein
MSISSAGLYYRLKDGFQVKLTDLSFWLDVLSALPLPLLVTSSSSQLLQLLTTAPRCLKIWKVRKQIVKD